MSIRRATLLWLKAAEEDLVDARDMLARGRWFRAAFFAQQAVEKVFKALFFVVRREEPPRIHTVTELYIMLREAGFSLPKSVEEQLYILNKYYTVTRYPDAAGGLPSESVDKVEAERAVKLAEEVITNARRFVRGG